MSVGGLSGGEYFVEAFERCFALFQRVEKLLSRRRHHGESVVGGSGLVLFLRLLFPFVLDVLQRFFDGAG